MDHFLEEKLRREIYHISISMPMLRYALKKRFNFFNALFRTLKK